MCLGRLEKDGIVTDYRWTREICEGGDGEDARPQGTERYGRRTSEGGGLQSINQSDNHI